MRSTLNQTLFLPLGVNDVRGQRCPIKGTHLSIPLEVQPQSKGELRPPKRKKPSQNKG
jgi:hypothetical protein